MKEITRLLSVVVIALVLMTAFSGVALVASQPVPKTPETETLTITTEIVCDRKVNVRVRNSVPRPLWMAHSSSTRRWISNHK